MSFPRKRESSLSFDSQRPPCPGEPPGFPLSRESRRICADDALCSTAWLTMISKNYLVASFLILGFALFSGNRVMPAPEAGMATAVNIDFQRQVRPILSDNCFHCHGPDEATRMVGLRLDTQQGAFEKRENGAVIIAGNSNGSLLYQRITAADLAQRMPPESSHKVLTND